MNIHEYQAKEILKSFSVKIQNGHVISSPSEALKSAKKMQKDQKSKIFVLKAQIHAGGRGKAGGIKLVKTKVVLVKHIDQVSEKAKNILGGTLVTQQTGEKGKVVNKLLIAEDVYYPGNSEIKEYYLGILLDRVKGCNVIMVSTEGGMEIEKVAEETPEKIIKIWIDPLLGIKRFQASELAYGLNLKIY
jgi:succinyl-CoA synthetase beta subunit